MVSEKRKQRRGEAWRELRKGKKEVEFVRR